MDALHRACQGPHKVHRAAPADMSVANVAHSHPACMEMTKSPFSAQRDVSNSIIK